MEMIRWNTRNALVASQPQRLEEGFWVYCVCYSYRWNGGDFYRPLRLPCDTSFIRRYVYMYMYICKDKDQERDSDSAPIDWPTCGRLLAS